MRLDTVVPFGRSLDEYRKMFKLTDGDLRLHVLGVGDGPASFNAELTAQGGKVVSVDPLYAFDAGEIKKRFDSVVDGIIEQVRNTPQDWVWSYHGSADDLRRNRIKVAEVFTADYAIGRHTERYVEGALPSLPFPDRQFDLALCSHFLFLYSDQFSYAFHQQAITEMLRVAREVRIFPLLTLMLQRSHYIPQLLQFLKVVGYVASVRRVEYELQRGGNEMLVINPIGQPDDGLSGDHARDGHLLE